MSAFLRYHGKKAEPWMYEVLALAFEMNKRDPASIKNALGWAGYLAKKTRDPVILIRVADNFLVRNLDEVLLPGNQGGTVPVRVGELLDLAMETGPQFPQPIWMSMKLATKSKDAHRMSDSVEHLLSLGWPGVDEAWRIEAHHQATDLAKNLSADGKDTEAKSLLASLSAADTRDLYIRLSWSGDAGLDLVVDEPLGATANYFSPRTVFGGAIIKLGRGKERESIYVCPRGFDGDYKIRVETFYNDAKQPVTTAKLEIVTHEGSSSEAREVKTLAISAKMRPVVVTLKGGRRKVVLPFQAPPLPPPPTTADPGKTESPPNTAKDATTNAGDAPKAPASPSTKPIKPRDKP